MPKHSISVPHRPQERDNSCLPACVRMILAFYGEEKSEGGNVPHRTAGDSSKWMTPHTNARPIR